jgi:hypothetical protein
MKNLTATQIKCIEKMKKDIELARSATDFDDYVLNKQPRTMRASYYENPANYEWERKYYENYKSGKVLVSGYGIPTLRALAKKGYVKDVEFTDYRQQGVIDWATLNEEMLEA